MNEDEEEIIELLRDQAQRYADGIMFSAVQARIEWRAADLIEYLLTKE